MKRLCLLLVILLLLPMVVGCRQTEAYTESLYYMDTVIGITLYTDDADAAKDAFAECRRILAELDALWSRRRTSSEIARLNGSESGLETLDARTYTLLATARGVSLATDGAFDLTVTPLAELWARCGTENRLPTEEELTSARSQMGTEKWNVTDTGVQKSTSQVAFDLGGIGKGAAISYLISYLESTEIEGGLVTFGSNVAVFGEKPDGEPFRVAIQHPRQTDAVIGKLTLAPGEILSVSGDYERYVTIGGTRYHHILDPKTGYPADAGLASVAVISEDGALADALSTALFVMGRDAALALYRSGVYDFEAIFVDVTGEVTVTDGLLKNFIAEG